MSGTLSELGMRLCAPELYDAYKNKLKNLLKADSGDYPATDRDGNPWANIGLVTIKDFSGSTRNALTQERIMQKYCIGDPLLLVPYPGCKNEVVIITLHGKQLGLLPDEGEFTDVVCRRLDENYDVFAQIYNYEVLHNGQLSCEIRIVYYVTPYDKGIQSST